MTPLWGFLVIAGSLLFLRWLWRIIWLPSATTCWACKGTGRRWGSTSKRHGPCLICRGRPEHFRRGAGLVYRAARKKR